MELIFTKRRKGIHNGTYILFLKTTRAEINQSMLLRLRIWHPSSARPLFQQLHMYLIPQHGAENRQRTDLMVENKPTMDP